MWYNWCDGKFDGISEIAAVLRNKGAVAVVPTETVYGLVGRVNDPACREKIYDLKHRDPAKHLGWFVANTEQLAKAGVKLDGFAAVLAGKFMPGPLTLIVPKDDGSTVGFRIPDHPQLLSLLREVDQPLFQTSANRSGCPNALSCKEAVDMLCGTPDAVADGGDISPEALASTIVDCTGTFPKVIRRGALDLDEFIRSLEVK